MSAGAGPIINPKGLVLYYDAENSQKSFKGKPLVNIVTNDFIGTVDATIVDIQAIRPDGSIGTVQQCTPVLTELVNRTVRTISVDLSAGETHTFSWYVKDLSHAGTFSGLVYDGTDATTITGISYQSEIIRNQWVRITQTFTVPGSSGPSITVDPRLSAMDAILDTSLARVNETSYTLTANNALTSWDNIGSGGASYDLDNFVSGVRPLLAGAALFDTAQPTTEYFSWLTPTGLPVDNFSIVCKLAFEDLSPPSQQTFVSQWYGAPTRGFAFQLHTTGALRFAMSTNGTTNSIIDSSALVSSLGVVVGQEVLVRVDRSGNDVDFYVSTNTTTPAWVQLGTTRSLGLSGNMVALSDPVRIGVLQSGNLPMLGTISSVVMYSDLTQTAEVFNFEVSDAANVDSTSWTSSGPNGETWDVTGDITFNPTDKTVMHFEDIAGSVGLRSSTGVDVGNDTTVFMVVKLDSSVAPVGNKVVVESFDSPTSRLAVFFNTDSTADITMLRGTSVPATDAFNNGITVISVQAPSAGNSRLKVSGGQNAIVTGDAGNQTLQYIRLGADYLGGSGMTGVIYEVAVLNGQLSDADVDTVHTGLLAKWTGNAPAAMDDALVILDETSYETDTITNVTAVRNRGTGGATYDLDTKVGGGTVQTISPYSVKFHDVAGNYFRTSTADAAAKFPVGIHSLVIELQLDDYATGATQVIGGAWNSSSNDLTSLIQVRNTGAMDYARSATGTSQLGSSAISSQTLPAFGIADGQRILVRIDKNGANVSYYVSTVLNFAAPVWVQLGNTINTGDAANLHVPSVPFEIGGDTGGQYGPEGGEIGQVIIYDDLTQSNAVMHFNPADSEDSLTSFVAVTGETWNQIGDLGVNNADKTVIEYRGAGFEPTSATTIPRGFTTIALFKPIERAAPTSNPKTNGIQMFDGPGTSSDLMYGIIESGTKIYVCGRTAYSADGRRCASLYCINKESGAEDWAIKYRPTDSSAVQAAFYDVVKVGEFLYTTGYSNGLAPTTTAYKGIFCKFDLSGNLIWQRQASWSGSHYQTTYRSIVHINESGTDYFYCVGPSMTASSGGDYGRATKWDVDGNLQWSRAVGGERASDSALRGMAFYKAVANPDGDGIIAAGFREKESSTDRMAMSCQITAAGAVGQIRTYTYTGDCLITAMAADSTYDYLAGETASHGQTIIKVTRATGAIAWAVTSGLTHEGSIYDMDLSNGGTELILMGRMKTAANVQSSAAFMTISAATGLSTTSGMQLVNSVDVDRGGWLRNGVVDDDNTLWMVGHQRDTENTDYRAMVLQGPNYGDDLVGTVTNFTSMAAVRETTPYVSTLPVESSLAHLSSTSTDSLGPANDVSNLVNTSVFLSGIGAYVSSRDRTFIDSKTDSSGARNAIYQDSTTGGYGINTGTTAGIQTGMGAYNADSLIVVQESTAPASTDETAMTYYGSRATERQVFDDTFGVEDWEWGSIGYHAAGVESLEHTMPELIVWDRNLAQDEIDAVVHYLSSKWSMAVQQIPTDTTHSIQVQVYRDGGEGRFLVTWPQMDSGSFVTPYVEGTRSDTDALVDLTGKTTLSPANLTFAANNTFSFNGSSDYMRPTAPVSYLTTSTFECWFKADTLPASGKKICIFGHSGKENYSFPPIGQMYLLESGVINATLITWSEVYRTTASLSPITTGLYYQVCMIKDLETGLLSLYVNGEFNSSTTFVAADYAQWTGAGSYIGNDLLDIGDNINTSAGQGWDLDFFDGEMPICKMYNTALTASEIKQNFDAMRVRYGI